jgi:hypothetical protein
LWAEEFNAKDNHKEICPVCGGTYLLRKAVQSWVEKFFEGTSKVANDTRLRQQSEDFYAAGFDALGKRWDKCMRVGGGYIEK